MCTHQNRLDKTSNKLKLAGGPFPLQEGHSRENRGGTWEGMLTAEYGERNRLEITVKELKERYMLEKYEDNPWYFLRGGFSFPAHAIQFSDSLT